MVGKSLDRDKDKKEIDSIIKEIKSTKEFGNFVNGWVEEYYFIRERNDDAHHMTVVDNFKSIFPGEAADKAKRILKEGEELKIKFDNASLPFEKKVEIILDKHGMSSKGANHDEMFQIDGDAISSDRRAVSGYDIRAYLEKEAQKMAGAVMKARDAGVIDNYKSGDSSQQSLPAVKPATQGKDNTR